MPELKTADLEGAALDWAVAKAFLVEVKVTCHDLEAYTIAARDKWGWHSPWSPSKYWNQGEPLIEAHGIETCRGNDLYFPQGNENGEHYEPLWLARKPGESWVHGPTPLTAAMRCLVAYRLGDTIDIPEELL